jgi:thymidylate kinase
MITKNVLNELFEQYDSHNIRYGVLRNYESLPDDLNSGDLDILIDAKSLKLNRKIITLLAEKLDLVIYHDYTDGRLFQFFLYKKIDNSNVFFLKLDFFIQSELHGCCYISNEEFLSGIRPYKNFYIIDNYDAVLDKLVYLFLLSAKIPEKYLDNCKKIVAEDNGLFKSRLNNILGEEITLEFLRLVSGEIESGIKTKAKFLVLARLFFKNLNRNLVYFPKYLFYSFKNRIIPLGNMYTFSGPDGSGKTTVIDLVSGYMNKAYRFEKSNLFHHRPSFLPRIAQILNKGGLIDEVDENYSEPHRGTPSGKVGSLIRLLDYILDYNLGYLFKIRKVLCRREPIIFDRYYYDVIADCERTNISLSQQFLTKLMFFVPKPSKSFFISVVPETVFQRKQELTLNSIIKLNGRYKNLVDIRDELKQVENDRAAVETSVEIMDQIITSQAKLIKKN